MLRKYYQWLHGQWPAGLVEKLPLTAETGETNVAGLYVAGDLTGIPLLKFSAESGVRCVQHIAEDTSFKRSSGDGHFDLAIVGLGVAGMAAALEATKQGLRFCVLEAARPFNTIANFPIAKPIYTYPTDMTPAGELQFGANTETREGLLEHLQKSLKESSIEVRSGRAEKITPSGSGAERLLTVALGGGDSISARRVIVAIGRSGDYRELGIPGEDADHVSNRLHDPKTFAGKNCVVIGGGDTAAESAIALAESGANVVLSYRKSELSRPKPDNVDAVHALAKSDASAGSLRLALGTNALKIGEQSVSLKSEDGSVADHPADAVFTMIGREAPLDFFQRSGVKIANTFSPASWLTLLLSVAIFTFVYHWKKTGVWIPIGDIFAERGWFPYNVPALWSSLGESFRDPRSLLGTLRVTLSEPGFYYSAAYCCAIVYFGIRRVARRKTEYVKKQTLSLALFQVIPLFLIPYFVLPWLGAIGIFDSGFGATIANELFPQVGYGHGREYWRAFGLILAWPLFLWNVFTDAPMWGWLCISFVQTFVIIPLLVYRFGKGAYCGWICSCGALAETMGDAHRHKMPHGPKINRLNMIGQAFLAFAFLLLAFRTLGWIWPEGPYSGFHKYLLKDIPIINYNWFVDLLFAGIIGVAFYWHFSGRAWCRFACPLAALMHIYARFSQFRILSEKKKCISCNVCTSVCHQGIDVMNFANKGLPMEDPQCVRCSACVQSCPTGVLSFGRVNRSSGDILGYDKMSATNVGSKSKTSLVVLNNPS